MSGNTGNNVLATIVQGSQVISALAPIGLELALKIKQLLSPLGPDIQVNIQQLGDDAISADQDTVNRVNDFLTANNLPLLS